MIPRAIAFLAWTTSLFGIVVAWPWSVTAPPEPPHPAVARIIALDLKGASLGTGTLVAVSDTHGLVITNWHVVRDARGAILVLFPDGFASPATVLRTDRDWDLAALAIWRPRATPVAIAQEAPRPGEWLAIAGYGQGAYRTVKGICTQYLAPTLNLPRELVELRAAARQGDSGGPIFNSRGELAGVLFGSGGSETMGSYCGRVREFLAPLKEPFYRLPIPQGMSPQLLAAGPPPLDASVLTVATPNSAVAGTPPLERLGTNSTSSQIAGTAVDSGSIPLTAVAASSLPGSGKANYGTAGSASNSPSSYASSSYASNLGSSGANGSGAWGNAPGRDGSGSPSAASSLASSSSGMGSADWRSGLGNDEGGSNSYGNGTSGYGKAVSAGSADPRGRGYQSAASEPGNSSPAASSFAYGNAPSSWDNTSSRGGTNDGGMSSFGDSARNGGGYAGNSPSAGTTTSGSAYASNSYGSGGYGRETSTTQYGFQGYGASGNADSSQYGPSSSGSSFANARADGSGRYSSSHPSPSNNSGSAGGYAAQGPRKENGADEKSYSSDLADRTWDYDREGNEPQRTSSSGVTASIGGNESRNSYSDRRSESFSTRIPDSGSQSASDGRPIPSYGTSGYSGGSSNTTINRSEYDSAGHQRWNDGYDGYGEAYKNDAGYGGRDSAHGSMTSRSSAYSSQDSRGFPTSGSGEENAGHGGATAREESSPKSYSTAAGSDYPYSDGYPKSGGGSYERTDAERPGSGVGSEKNGYGGSGYGNKSEADYGRDAARSNSPYTYTSSASAYGLGSAEKRDHEERDDPYSENKGGTSRYGEAKSPYASSRPTGGNYESSGLGNKATSGSTSSTSYAGSDYRSGQTGYSTPERSGAEPSSVSRPTAIPPTETSADHPPTSRQTAGSVETAVPAANPPTSSQQPPAASSGVGMETLLGLVGLLILFVQSMRWLSGFYDRSYRRRRTWRSTRRRPYYDRDVRPAYRSYW